MVTPAARREAVAHLQIAYEVSERRACSALGADRTSVRYRSSRPNDAPLVSASATVIVLHYVCQ
jgi:putative transposase